MLWKKKYLDELKTGNQESNDIETTRINKSLEGQSALKKGQMEAGNVWLYHNWDGFIVWHLSQILIVKTLLGQNFAQTENSFWPANIVFMQLRHFFSLKIGKLCRTKLETIFWTKERCLLHNAPLSTYSRLRLNIRSFVWALCVWIVNNICAKTVFECVNKDFE